MKKIICLFCIACIVGWVNAQQSNLWASIETDSVLSKEFNAMCQRELPFKVAEAKRFGLDTLPAFRDSVEVYRKLLAYTYWSPRDCSQNISEELRVKFRQVLFRLPQSFTVCRVRQAEQRMDSLAKAIARGVSFEDCVQRFSAEKNDRWIARLEVPTELEEVAFNLQPGEVSKPFFTPEGIHLIKVLDRSVFSVRHSLNENSKAIQMWVEELKNKYQFVAHYQSLKQWLRSGKAFGAVFFLGGRDYTAVELNRFASYYPASRMRQLDAFIRKTVLDKAYATMEADNPSISSALQTYGDSLLAREVCKRKMELEGIGDEDDLNAYFVMHQSEYQWKDPHYHAVVIHAVNKRVAKQVRKFLKGLSPSEWKEAVRLTFDPEKQSEVCVEEGVFALGDNVYVDDLLFKKNDAPPKASHPVTMAIGKKVKGPQDYRQVRAEVWRDFLADWEKRWMNESE